MKLDTTRRLDNPRAYRSEYAELVQQFLRSGYPSALVDAESDDPARVYGSLWMWLNRHPSLPVYAQMRRGEVWLLRLEAHRG